MRGIDTLIGAIVLIGLSVSIAAMVAPALYSMAANPNPGPDQAACRSTAYGFDSSYGTYGVNYSLSPPYLKARVVNTGSMDVHGFFFELVVEESGARRSYFFEPTEESQRTVSNQLRVGREATVEANITEAVTGTLKAVRLLNRPCPGVYASAEF
jgi:hypothetical protein